MAALCWAQLAIAALPFGWWRKTVGQDGDSQAGRTVNDGLKQALALAAVVERAADRLPMSTKCLPRSITLSWMLRRKGIGHAMVFAVRPADLRSSNDALHAWIEVQGRKVIGDLPGPWLETLRLGGQAPPTPSPFD